MLFNTGPGKLQDFLVKCCIINFMAWPCKRVTLYHHECLMQSTEVHFGTSRNAKLVFISSALSVLISPMSLMVYCGNAGSPCKCCILVIDKVKFKNSFDRIPHSAIADLQ